MLERTAGPWAGVGDPKDMKPFAIAGIQMHLNHGSNIAAMRQRIDLTMHLYPWVQMVMFSELAAFGPYPENQPPPTPEVVGHIVEVVRRLRVQKTSPSAPTDKDAW